MAHLQRRETIRPVVCKHGPGGRSWTTETEDQAMARAAMYRIRIEESYPNRVIQRHFGTRE